MTKQNMTEQDTTEQHMTGHEIEIDTPAGEINTFVALPNRDEPSPVVLFLMDAPGMRDELRDMCRRIAAEGYFVIAPNLYFRQVRQYNVFESQDRDRMFELMHSLTNSMVVEDARHIIRWADGHRDADTSRVGTVGYCMSGPFALMVAAGIPDQVVAAASIHGVSLATEADDSPHLNLSNDQAEVYVACAESDSYAPPEVIAEFEAALADSPVEGRVEWYPGTEHGFAFAERPQYVREASEQHWDRILDLFQRTLR